MISSSIEALRAEFVREGYNRLRNARVLLEELQDEEHAGACMTELARVFHAFAGTGTTFGFPLVTDLGAQGERLCEPWRRGASGAPTAAERETCADLLDQIDAALATPGTAAHAPAKDPAPRDVLLVEDDNLFAEVLAAALETEGFRVRRAASLAEAERECQARAPDAAVLDVMLPDGLVYPFVERLRAGRGGESLPVLCVTARRGLPDRVEAVRCGADAFFVKPVDLDALVARLLFLLGREAAEPARILSVEDDAHQSEFLRVVLATAGYEFRSCPDVARVEAELAAFRPHLLLMDVLLPGVSGFDVVRALRQEERYATLPIIFLTTEALLRDRAAVAGGDEFLVKPVTPGLLLTTVAARLERARVLADLMQRDALTGLLTHGAFLERVNALAAQRAPRDRAPLALALLDLDSFKAVNDRHGHLTGDHVLASLGRLLRRRLRQSDVVGRYGGEEFGLIVEGLGLRDAARLTRRLLDEFLAVEHAGNDGARFRVTFSAGVALLEPGLTADAWLERADHRLYAAKAAGRARVVASD